MAYTVPAGTKYTEQEKREDVFAALQCEAMNPGLLGSALKASVLDIVAAYIAYASTDNPTINSTRDSGD